MILKYQSYDGNNHIKTEWFPNVIQAECSYDDGFKSNVLSVYIAGKDNANTNFILTGNSGLYLCNDEGKTIEVLSRLPVPAVEEK